MTFEHDTLRLQEKKAADRAEARENLANLPLTGEQAALARENIARLKAFAAAPKPAAPLPPAISDGKAERAKKRTHEGVHHTYAAAPLTVTMPLIVRPARDSEHAQERSRIRTARHEKQVPAVRMTSSGPPPASSLIHA